MKKRIYTTLFLLLFSTSIIHPALIRESFVANAEDEEYIVAVFTGEGSRTDRGFIISDPQFRIEYSYITDNPSTADFQIFVFQMSVPFVFIDSIWESGVSKNGFKDIFAGNDSFFISIQTNDIESWQVTISQQSIPTETPIVDYDPLVNFSGTTGTTTESFHISTDHFIVDWNYGTTNPTAGFFVLLYESGVIDNYLQYFGDFGPGRDDFEYIYPGQYTDFYFLIVTDENVTNWDLVVKTPLPLLSNITCAANPTIIQKGNRVIINGSIVPAIAGSIITLTFTDPFNDTFAQTTETGANGTYSFHLYPTLVGNYSVVASWDGGPFCEGSTSESAIFMVQSKIPTTITCTIPKSYFSLNESITVTGSLDPPLEGVNITLDITDPHGLNNPITVKTDEHGNYIFKIKPTSEGFYIILARWSGDLTHSDTTSYLVMPVVNKASSNLTCNVNPPQTSVTHPINIQGNLNPRLSGEQVTLTFYLPDFTQITDTVITNQDGAYQYTFYPPINGTTIVRASWSGNDVFFDGQSSDNSFNVTRIHTSISCGVSKNKVSRTGSIHILGSISEEISTEITLHITNPDMTLDQPIVVTTKPDGSYNHTLNVNIDSELGLWSVYATMEGNTIYEEAISDLIPYTVTEEPPGMIFQIGAHEDHDTTRSLGGVIDPPRPGKVIIKVEDPKGKVTSYTAQVEDGYFDYDITIDEVGAWVAEATFEGDDGSIVHSAPQGFQYVSRPYIPGYPLHSILLGVVASLCIMWVMRKKN